MTGGGLVCGCLGVLVVRDDEGGRVELGGVEVAGGEVKLGLELDPVVLTDELGLELDPVVLTGDDVELDPEV